MPERRAARFRVRFGNPCPGSVWGAVLVCLSLGGGLFPTEEAPAASGVPSPCAGTECGPGAGPGPAGTSAAQRSLASCLRDSGSGNRQPDIPPRLSIVLHQAQKRMEAGSNEDAVRLLREHLAKDPTRDHSLLEFLLGNALHAAGRPGEALDAYRKAVCLEPCYGPAWVNLGQAAMEGEDFPLAAESFVRGYALMRPENPEILYYAAVAHVLNGGHEEAAALLESLPGNRTGRPNREWARTLLHAYMELGRKERAEALLERMLASFPQDPEVWRYAWRFEANRQNYEKAVVNLVVLSYLTDLTREERLLLGDLYSAIHVPLAATEQYELALKDSPSVTEAERLALSYLAAHRPEAAHRTLRSALAERPSAKLWLLLGEMHAMQEEYPAALEAFRESARLDPEGGGRAHLMMGYCALQEGRKEVAIPALRKAREFPQHQEDARRLLEQAGRMDTGKGTAP